MLRKTLLTLCASALLGVAAMAPNTALAFFPPPPPGGLGGLPPLAHLGPPPMAHLGGPPPMAHLGGLPHARLGGPAGRPAGLSRFGGRAAGYGAGRASSHGYGRSTSAGYNRSGRSSYDRSYSRYRHWGRYVGYGSASGRSNDDGCSYAYTSSGRRIAVCDDN
jgi:hypothetical protein